MEKGRRMREKKTGTNKKLRGGGVDAAAETAFSMCVCVRMMCGIKENGGCWRNHFFPKYLLQLNGKSKIIRR